MSESHRRKEEKMERRAREREIVLYLLFETNEKIDPPKSRVYVYTIDRK